jgi:hypothetical protein
VAVVVVNYIKNNARRTKAAKENIKYIEQRPGKDGAKIWRTLFGNDGRMSRQQAYELIDQAEKGSVFWRIKISPDAKTEDTKRDLSMQEVTEQTMNSLNEQLGKQISYVAAIHADHSSYRHIHVLAILPKLSRQEFEQVPEILIQGATEDCLEQRRELDRIREYQRGLAREREEAAWERER